MTDESTIDEDKKMRNDYTLEEIRSFMRSCNHWFRLRPDEESVFADAAYRGSQMEREHCVEKLAAIFNEESPHHMAMIAQEAYRGIYHETNLRNDVKTDIQKRLEKIWKKDAKGHEFTDDAIVLDYLSWEFRAAIDYNASVDRETFGALCFGLYMDFETDYLDVDDCWTETYFWEQHLDSLDFNGLRKELLDIEAKIKKIVGPSPIIYYQNHCRNRNRFDRRLINLFERRKIILNRMVLSTEEEKTRFCAVNELLHDLTKEMYRRTGNLYRSNIGKEDGIYEAEGKLSYHIVWDGTLLINIRLLDSDSTYGSDFKYMMMAAYQQQKMYERESGESHIISCSVGYSNKHDATTSDEELGLIEEFDGEDWYVTHYSDHPMSETKICYAMHKLLDESLLSMPDIMKIERFKVESKIVSSFEKVVK